jgi:hypothetical protein
VSHKVEAVLDNPGKVLREDEVSYSLKTFPDEGLVW